MNDSGMKNDANVGDNNLFGQKKSCGFLKKKKYLTAVSSANMPIRIRIGLGIIFIDETMNRKISNASTISAETSSEPFCYRQKGPKEAFEINHKNFTVKT